MTPDADHRRRSLAQKHPAPVRVEHDRRQHHPGRVQHRPADQEEDRKPLPVVPSLTDDRTSEKEEARDRCQPTAINASGPRPSTAEQVALSRAGLMKWLQHPVSRGRDDYVAHSEHDRPTSPKQAFETYVGKILRGRLGPAAGREEHKTRTNRPVIGDDQDTGRTATGRPSCSRSASRARGPAQGAEHRSLHRTVSRPSSRDFRSR